MLSLKLKTKLLSSSKKKYYCIKVLFLNVIRSNTNTNTDDIMISSVVSELVN